MIWKVKKIILSSMYGKIGNKVNNENIYCPITLGEYEKVNKEIRYVYINTSDLIDQVGVFVGLVENINLEYLTLLNEKYMDNVLTTDDINQLNTSLKSITSYYFSPIDKEKAYFWKVKKDFLIKLVIWLGKILSNDIIIEDMMNIIEFDLDYKGEFKSMLEDILNRVLEVMYLEI